MSAATDTQHNKVTMKKLFGADGIRGIIDQYPFRAEDLVRFGQALAQWWLDRNHGQSILLGTDTRESNQRIKGALVEGLTRAGIEVWDAGILPTASISYLVASQDDLGGGIMVSASHNPIFENGIKVFSQYGTKISDDNELDIEGLFFSKDLRLRYLENPAKVRFRADLAYQYIRSIIYEFAHIKWHKNKVLVDCANGASYMTAQAILSELGIHYALYNALPDGTNINFSAGSEHVRKSPAKFARELQKGEMEIGISFDGDADRVVFVDQRGTLFDGDMLLAVLAITLQNQGRLEKNTIVLTQMSNSGLSEHLRTFQIESKTVVNGDKYISDTLIAENLTLGGEQIGHLIIHTDPCHVTGDGLRTALCVLEALAAEPDLCLRDLTRGLVKWPQVNISASLDNRILSKAEVIPKLSEIQQYVQNELKDLTRFECRPASTEPVYRIMLEARSTPLLTLAGYGMAIARYVQTALGKANSPVEILDCVNGGLISPTFAPYLPE